MLNNDVGQLCVHRFIIICSALVTSLVRLTAWSSTMTSEPLFLEFEQSEIHRTDSLMLSPHVNSMWMAPLNKRNKWQPFHDSRNALCKICDIIRKLFVLLEITKQLYCWTRQSRLCMRLVLNLSPQQIYESRCVHLWTRFCESWGTYMSSSANITYVINAIFETNTPFLILSGLRFIASQFMWYMCFAGNRYYHFHGRNFWRQRF